MVKRSASILATFATIIAGFIAIIQVYNNEAKIIEFVESQSESLSFLKYLTSFAPTLIISLINVILPTVNKRLVQFEQYPFAETQIKNEIWRNYLSKILNLTLFLSLNLPEVIDGQVVAQYLLLDKEVLERKKIQNECNIDTASVNLIRLALTELFVLIGAQYSKAAFYFVFQKLILKQKRWKPKLYLSDFTLWLLYNQTIHWLTLLLFPFFVLVAPIIDLIAFFVIYNVIKNFYSKVGNQAADIGYFIMILLNFSFFLVLIFYGLWFSLEHSYDCGPIAKGKSGFHPIEQGLGETAVPRLIHQLFTYFPLTWYLIAITFTFGYFNDNQAQVLQSYIDEQKTQFKKTIEDNQKLIGKLERKLDFQKESLAAVQVQKKDERKQEVQRVDL